MRSEPSKLKQGQQGKNATIGDQKIAEMEAWKSINQLPDSPVSSFSPAIHT
jgi:hypothetical protein